MESYTTHSSEPRSAGLPLPYDQQLAGAASLLAQVLSQAETLRGVFAMPSAVAASAGPSLALRAAPGSRTVLGAVV
jgi:hypothetical protein